VSNYALNSRKKMKKKKKTKKKPLDEAAEAAQVDSDRAAQLFWLKEAEARKRVAQALEADERKRLVQEREQHKKSDR
jgi:hypothetical protein